MDHSLFDAYMTANVCARIQWHDLLGSV